MFAVIPVDRIHPNPEQPRKNFPLDELRSLSESIKVHGVIQPIDVEQLGDDFLLNDGERRLRACKMAGLKTIPAMIRAGEDTTSLDRLERALVTSIQRAGLNAIEEAHAFYRLVNEFGLTQNRVGLSIGRTPGYVTQRLLLLRLDVSIQDLISSGRLSADPVLARDLLRIPNTIDRIGLAAKLADDDATIHECRQAAKDMTKREADSDRASIAAGALDLSPIDLPIMIRVSKTHARVSLPDWNILAQAGQVPPWPAVQAAAQATCSACALRPFASKDITTQGVWVVKESARRALSGRGHPYEKKSPISAIKQVNHAHTT